MNPQAANPVGRPPMTDQERQIQIIHGVMESCPFKFATSGVIGKFGIPLHQGPTHNSPHLHSDHILQVLVWVQHLVFSCHPLNMLDLTLAKKWSSKPPNSKLEQR